MPVTWDIKGCPDFYKHFPDQGPEGDREWNGLFIAITYIMLAIGPPPAKADDTKGFDEFWFRLDTYQRVIGALASKLAGEGEAAKREDVYITEEQARALIGLRTNHSKVTASSFNAWLVRCLRNEHARRNAKNSLASWGASSITTTS